VLILSILALFAGPLLYHWLRRGGRMARVVDTVIVGILVVLVAVFLVPESLAGLGYPALALIAAGYLVPGLLERAVRGAARAFHLLSLGLALAGLLLHAVLDGAGLASVALQSGSTLALAIVLHRFGMGLVIWLIVQPGFGRGPAIAILGLMCVATIAGYLLSEHFLAVQGQNAVLVVQALIIGTIIHSLLHRGHTGHHVSVKPAS
jgi:hypothetical protein